MIYGNIERREGQESAGEMWAASHTDHTHHTNRSENIKDYLETKRENRVSLSHDNDCKKIHQPVKTRREH